MINTTIYILRQETLCFGNETIGKIWNFRELSTRRIMALVQIYKTSAWNYNRLTFSHSCTTHDISYLHIILPRRQ